jgi:hypothetical protein
MVASALAWQARRMDAFGLARRALELADEESPSDAVTLLRAIARNTPSAEIARWASEIADPDPGTAPGDAVCVMQAERSLEALERVVTDRVRGIGRSHSEALSLRNAFGEALSRTRTPCTGTRSRGQSWDVRARRCSTAATHGRVIESVRNGIVLRSSNSPGIISRVGGGAILAHGDAWPVGRDGWPMVPVATIDLAERPDLAPLPDDGMLLLYWDRDGAGGTDPVSACRVFWLSPGAPADEPAEPDSYPGSYEATPITGTLMPVAGDWSAVLESVQGASDWDELITVVGELDFTLYTTNSSDPRARSRDQ